LLLSLPLAEMAQISKSTAPGVGGAVQRTWKVTSLASPCVLGSLCTTSLGLTSRTGPPASEKVPTLFEYM
jgi:hypothetical protein